jgi:hypothetical protein
MKAQALKQMICKKMELFANELQVQYTTSLVRIQPHLTELPLFQPERHLMNLEWLFQD